MTKLKVFGIAVLSFAIVIGGCGNLGKNADNANREEATIIKESEKEGGTLQKGAGYGFTLFDLEIEIDGSDTVDALYDVTTENIKAEYENKLNNVDLEGPKAFDEIDKLFTYILITKATPGEELINKVMKFYNIDAYSEFKLYIDFDDGTVLDINDVK